MWPRSDPLQKKKKKKMERNNLVLRKKEGTLEKYIASFICLLVAYVTSTDLELVIYTQ